MQFMYYDVPRYISDKEIDIRENEYKKNPEVKKLIDKACSSLEINQYSDEYISIASNKAPKDVIANFALNPKMNITLGIAKLSEFYRIAVTTDTYDVEKTPYGALEKYCGTKNAENEDLYFRNYLADLVEEEPIYEEKYIVS